LRKWLLSPFVALLVESWVLNCSRFYIREKQEEEPIAVATGSWRKERLFE